MRRRSVLTASLAVLLLSEGPAWGQTQPPTTPTSISTQGREANTGSAPANPPPTAGGLNTGSSLGALVQAPGGTSAPASSSGGSPGGGSDGANLTSTSAGGYRYDPSYSGGSGGGGGSSAPPYDRTKDPAIFDQASGTPLPGDPCTNYGNANAPCISRPSTPGPTTPSTPAAAAAAGTPASTVPRRSAAQIARDAADRAIDRPVVYTSPVLGSDALVNLPTWLGVENWQPNTVSASEGGLTITVTARPTSVVWQMGESSVTCIGPGARYAAGVREEQQRTDCSYTYRHSSAGQPGEKYQATATLRYAVTWSASNGESGSLGTGSRTTPFAVRVAERQALSTKAA